MKRKTKPKYFLLSGCLIIVASLAYDLLLPKVCNNGPGVLARNLLFWGNFAAFIFTYFGIIEIVKKWISNKYLRYAVGFSITMGILIVFLIIIGLISTSRCGLNVDPAGL